MEERQAAARRDRVGHGAGGPSAARKERAGRGEGGRWTQRRMGVDHVLGERRPRRRGASDASHGGGDGTLLLSGPGGVAVRGWGSGGGAIGGLGSVTARLKVRTPAAGAVGGPDSSGGTVGDPALRRRSWRLAQGRRRPGGWQCGGGGG
nr:heterogeneous nuclear ribonucleoprotein A0-like [Aegilops tauschii subsp. strangulata]